MCIRDRPDLERIGLPGEYPYTRGVYPSMYRGRLWTMRQFAGFGTAEETNERFRYLLDHGQTGLSTAFDMPSLMGHDSDHARSLGEGGREVTVTAPDGTSTQLALTEVGPGRHQATYAAGTQIQCRRRTEAAQANHQHRGFEQSLLPAHIDFRQQQVPAVAQQLLVIHVRAPAPSLAVRGRPDHARYTPARNPHPRTAAGPPHLAPRHARRAMLHAAPETAVHR